MHNIVKLSLYYLAADKTLIQTIALTKVARDLSIAIPWITRLVYNGVNTSTGHKQHAVHTNKELTQQELKLTQ